MNVIIKVSIISLVYVLLTTILKKYSPEFVFLLRICTVAIVFITIIDEFTNIITNAFSIFYALNIESSHLQLLLKVVGIALVSDYICDVLKDSGEKSIATIVSTISKFLIIYLSMPLLNSLILFSLKLVE